MDMFPPPVGMPQMRPVAPVAPPAPPSLLRPPGGGQGQGMGALPFPTPPMPPGGNSQFLTPGGQAGAMVRQGIIQNALFGNPYTGQGGAMSPMISQMYNQINPQERMLTTPPVPPGLQNLAQHYPVPGSTGGYSGPNQDWRALAIQDATDLGVPSDMFSRQINQESGFNPNAGSSAGAEGIAQFMPGTAQGLGINPWDPTQSLQAAARLMKNYYDQYGSWAAALAAYNGGPGTAQDWINSGYDVSVLPAETQRYLQAILGSQA